MEEMNRTVYIHNLADGLGSQRLREQLYLLFSTCGEVVKVSVNVRKNRGQAFVTMKTVDESNLAVSILNGETFMGKRLSVEFSKQETLKL